MEIVDSTYTSAVDGITILKDADGNETDIIAVAKGGDGVWIYDISDLDNI